MITFNKINIQNFFNFKELEYIFQEGLTLVNGKNGSGKSSLIIDSIIWCLYGKTLRGIAGDEVVNNKVKKDCKVSLHIKSDDKDYTLTRTRKLSKAKKPNDFIITCDGNDIQLGTTKDTDEMVYKIVGYDYETFVQSVFLCSNNKFFCSLTDSEKKEILDNIINTNVYDEYKDKVSLIIKTKTKEKDLLDNNLSNSQLLLTNKQRALDNEHMLYESWKTKQIEKRQTLIKTAGELLKNKNLLEEQLKSIEPSIDVSSLDNKITDIELKISKLEKNNTKVQNNFNNLSKKTPISILENDIRKLLKAIEGYKNLSNTQCSTCHQDITGDYVDKCTQELLDNKKEIQVQLEKLIEEEKELVTQKNEVIEENNDAIKSYKQNIQQLNKEKTILNERLFKSKSIEKDIKVLEEKLANNKKEHEHSAKEANPHERLKNSLSNEIHELKDSIEETQKNLVKINKELEHYKFWETSFSNKGIKSYLYDNVIPYLNEKVNYYAKELFTTPINISINTQSELKSGKVDEKLNISINYRGVATDYSNLSSGERRRVDICVGLALGNLADLKGNNVVKFKALDEIFDSLEEDGVSSVIKLLNVLKNEYKSIYVISHLESIKDRFKNVINIDEVSRKG